MMYKLSNLIFLYFWIIPLLCFSEVGTGKLLLKFDEKVESININGFNFRGSNIRLSEIPHEIPCQQNIALVVLNSYEVLIENLEEGTYAEGYHNTISFKYGFILPSFIIKEKEITKLNVKVRDDFAPTVDKIEGVDCGCDINCIYRETKSFTKHTKIPNGFVVDFINYSGANEYYLKNGGLIFLSNGKHRGVLNNKGEWVIEPIFQDIQSCSYSDFIYQVEQNNKIGYFDILSKKMIIPTEYEKTKVNYGGGYFILKKENKYGVLDSLRQIIIPFEYDYIDSGGYRNFNEFIVKLGNKYAIFELSKKLTDFKYDNIFRRDFDRFCYIYIINEKFGYLKKNGQDLTLPIFTRPNDFYQYSKCTDALLNGQKVYLNKEGKITDSGLCN